MSEAIQEWLMVTWNAIIHRTLQRRRCIANFLCMQINKIESGIFERKTSVSRFFFLCTFANKTPCMHRAQCQCQNSVYWCAIRFSSYTHWLNWIYTFFDVCKYFLFENWFSFFDFSPVCCCALVKKIYLLSIYRVDFSLLINQLRLLCFSKQSLFF